MTVRTGLVEVVEEAPRPEPDGGFGALRTERGNLPLEMIEVRSSVTGLAVRTELAQGFRNPYDVPLEATYIFPLPDRAAVTRLRLEAADRVVEGVVKEREAARADYDTAIAEGRRASIAEEERPGVFTLRVGNIMPGERVVVRTTLSGRLPYEDGEATFRFPLVVAPRYIPGAALPGGQVGDGTAADTDQVPDASRISPPILLPGFPNPVRLSIEVAVDPAGLPLAGLTSGLHGVSVAEDDGRYVVRLDPGARADRDFVLRLGYGGPVAATSLAVAWDEAAPASEASPDSEASPAAQAPTAEAPGTGTFLLTVLPPEPTGATRPRDVVLVLDRSGSMGGWKMTAARRAAARIVDTLTAADRFAVLTFDHEVESPTGLPDDALATATDRHRFRAVQHLASVEARGGTEMVEPLQRAAALLAGDAAERDRVLILVTDGQVGNEDALLSALGPRLTRLRVHTVGIDSAVNAGFLRRLAGAGGGHCELVESEDRLDAAMDAIHRRIGTALVTGLRLGAIGGLAEVDQNSVTPARLPDLFAGAPLVIAGRIGEGVASVRARTRSGEPGIVITGQASDGSAWRRRVAAVETTDADLAQFWARGRIRDLEDEYLSTYQGQADIERAIVATSVGYGVLSCFTAFVAVDTRVVNEGGVTKRVTQPVDLPHGWADEAPVFLEAAIAAAAPSAPPKPAPMYRTRSARAFPAPAAPGAAPTPSAEPFRDLSRAADKEKKVATPTGQPDTTITHAFATIWLTRLTAAANATTEAQEALLTEFTAALRTLSPHSTPDAARYQELLDTLEATDNSAADRLQSAIKYLESLDTPRRRPFWKR